MAAPHLHERDVAQDAGVVDHGVELAVVLLPREREQSPAVARRRHERSRPGNALKPGDS
jgi:hypothetical protein